MCGFISWIETSLISPKSGLFYLTDAQAYSDRGKEVLAGAQDNDILGHGAIRAFYDLGQVGKEHEVTDFWNLEKLPSELQEKIRNFDLYWGRMFRSGCFQDDDLRHILLHAPSGWREKAWTQLLMQHPTNSDFLIIVRDAPAEWKERASAQLFEQDLSNEDLRYIMAYGTPELQEKAWKRLMEQGPSSGELCAVVAFTPQQWKERAWDMLTTRELSDENLRFLEMHAPHAWAQKVRVELVKRGKGSLGL